MRSIVSSRMICVGCRNSAYSSSVTRQYEMQQYVTQHESLRYFCTRMKQNSLIPETSVVCGGSPSTQAGLGLGFLQVHCGHSLESETSMEKYCFLCATVVVQNKMSSCCVIRFFKCFVVAVFANLGPLPLICIWGLTGRLLTDTIFIFDTFNEKT